MRAARSRLLAVVIGSAELGSAIAVRLTKSGLGVVLCDEVDPPWIRRGMAFTDAWYFGSACVEGVQATFCASVRSIPTVLANRPTVAATTWSWPGVAAALNAGIVIDTRCLHAGTSPDLIASAPDGVLTVGIGPWYIPGDSAHITICRRAPRALKRTPPDLGSQACDPLASEPSRIALYAPCPGRFQSRNTIGDFVVTGQTIAAIGTAILTAPATGVLSGLAPRGSRPEMGTRVAEVDTRGEPGDCFAIPDWCECLAAEVAERVFSPLEVGMVDASADHAGLQRETADAIDLPIWEA